MPISRSTLRVTDALKSPRDMAVLEDSETDAITYAPLQALCNAAMVEVNPATTEDITALSAKLPAQVAGAVPVITKGSVGEDHSLYGDAAVWPHLGQPIAAGVFNGWAYLGAVTLTGAAGVHIENYADQVVLMLFDDNVAAGANPPLNATAFVLPFGIAGGAAPAPYVDDLHKGRIQFYAPAALAGTAYIAIRKL